MSSLPVPLDRHAPSPSSLLGREVGSSVFHVCSLLSAGAVRTLPAASYLRRASEPLVPHAGQSHCSNLIAADERFSSRAVSPPCRIQSALNQLRWCREESGTFCLFIYLFIYCMHACDAVQITRICFFQWNCNLVRQFKELASVLTSVFPNKYHL